MNHHCGLLNVRPEESWTLNRYRTKSWKQLPKHLQRPLQIFLATPGFSANYFRHNLKRSLPMIQAYRDEFARFEDWEEEAVENWMSISREDAIRLAWLRPENGDWPLVSQLRALEDLKFMSMAEVARTYGVNMWNIFHLKKRGPVCRQPLPPGFEWLVAKRR